MGEYLSGVIFAGLAIGESCSALCYPDIAIGIKHDAFYFVAVQIAFVQRIVMVGIRVGSQAVGMKHIDSLVRSGPYPPVSVFAQCPYTPFTIVPQEEMSECVGAIVLYGQVQPSAERTYPHPSLVVFQDTVNLVGGYRSRIGGVVAVVSVTDDKPFASGAIPFAALGVFGNGIDVCVIEGRGFLSGERAVIDQHFAGSSRDVDIVAESRDEAHGV